LFGNGSQLTGLAATYGNANVATLLADFGSNTVSTTGNISGGFILGNGSQLTGLPATYGNANVATFMAAFGSNTVSTTGNITTTANISGGFILGNVAFANGISTYGNANVVANLAALGSNPISTTGNVTGNYFIGNGSQLTGITAASSYGNSNVATLLSAFGSNTISTTGNITAGGLRKYAQSSAPTNPVVGDVWYKTDTDVFYQYVNDGTSNFWLDISSLPSTFANVNITSNLTISGNVSSSIVPVLNNTYSLGSTTRYWSTVYGVAVNAQYADLAEIYKANCDLEPGEVVIFGGEEEITKTDISHDDRVAGVISTAPAYLMNSKADGYPVALQGRVPCLVRGPVSKGQAVVTSDLPGIAIALDKTRYTPGCIIGKSLGAINTTDIELIEVVVGRL
jgi:hypothetical protein